MAPQCALRNVLQGIRLRLSGAGSIPCSARMRFTVLRAARLLKEGFYADIVIFDPDTVIDKATYEEPHQYSEGYCQIKDRKFYPGPP